MEGHLESTRWTSGEWHPEAEVTLAGIQSQDSTSLQRRLGTASQPELRGGTGMGSRSGRATSWIRRDKAVLPTMSQFNA